MEFTELADYPVPVGALTEWLLCAQSDWVDDPRPASYVHEAHLRRTAKSGSRESWLGTAFEIPGALDADAFRSALEKWTDRHEVLRSHTTLDAETELVRRYTVPRGGLHVGVVSHGYDAAGGDNFAHLQQLFDEYASPHSWPSYVFATLEIVERDRFIVFFAADHSIIDGYSIVLVAHELSALYEESVSGRTVDLFPVGSYIDFGHEEREASTDPEAERKALDLWRSTLEESGPPEFPLDIGPRTQLPQQNLSAWILDADQAAAFNRACSEAEVGFFPGLLACLGLAGVEVAGQQRFRTITPVHTRRAPQWTSALGWFVSLSPIDFEVRSSDFGAVAREADASLSRTKPVSVVPFDRIGNELGTPARPRFVVSYMDVRFVPESGSWPQRNARALRSRQYTHDVYAWINRTPQGVNLAVRYPGNDIASANVHTWVAALRRHLDQVSTSYLPVGFGSISQS
ncbi:condensation protein [Rhodococcus sp. WMMA185]|uniref:condensation domain-containing protein n=1 Tax=Rhodococcus sp. WMMA185 TaxID=679318 RepID=UPI000878FE27|nr:condensation domain-containing protein [Rhodococcus sp. WMMA185]AOW92199.1 condensation protein [Rhodococcus sp. WMMA185]